MVVLTSFTQPTNGIRHRQQNTVVYVNNNNLGKGTLFIAESRLSWIGESGNGFSIEYPHIALHAISRDLSAFPQECLFLMLDTPLADDDDQNNEEDEDVEGDDSDKQGTTELRIVPDDRGMLDAMFHAMNECQALHPDPEDSFSDEDFFEDADDESPMEEADSHMARLRIGNMDERAHMEDMVEDMAEDMVEDMVEDIVEGRVGGMRECMALGILGGMGEGRVGDIRENMALSILGGMGEDRLGGRVVGRVVGRMVGRKGGIRESMASGISGGMGEGRAVGMEGDMEEGILCTSGGRGAGTVEGTLRILGGREEGMVEDTSHISGGREEGMVAGTLHISGGREAGKEGGRGAGMEQGISRHDRSLFLGNMSHRDSSAVLPLAHSPQTALDSNFDDAEN